ncbi:thiamine-phosphate kinase [Fodinicola acaciae]|uniref:thiamine-phosphate kinase n=1 Tax=Fodinicola acaciae TaxID=2681555 RepID=UPI0013D7D50A|nr:thiamine-phosphate kinase [Fodinicola acaciae]
MSVGDVGEFGLIAGILARLPQGATSLLGPGDDAAVVRATDGRVVASTDLMLEGRHFRRDWSSGRDVGHKLAAANLADIAAMGAAPTALLVGLACPPDIEVAWVEEFTDGLRDECARIGASVVGGDISRADVIMLSATALGDLAGIPPVTRAGARPGDTVAVAGRLGYAAAGIAALTRGFRSPRVLVDAHRRPEPPYAAGPTAAALGATSMCDVSDGLLSDAGHIASASGVSIDLESAAFDVPEAMANAATALGHDTLRWILTGGDDHALLATFPAAVRLPASWRPVGHVVAAGAHGPAVTVDGGTYDGPPGHDHFTNP